MKRFKLGNDFIALTVILFMILSLQALGTFRGINEWVNSTLPLIDAPLMHFLTAFGGDLFLIPFIITILYLDWRGGSISRRTVAFILATTLGLAAVGALKFLFAETRPRPYGSGIGGYAFPSGHTFRAAIVATYVSDRWKKYAFFAWIYAVGIALTRLFLHYHWLSDVLFSLAFAPWLYLLLKSLLGVGKE